LGRLVELAGIFLAKEGVAGKTLLRVKDTLNLGKTKQNKTNFLETIETEKHKS